MWHVWVSCKRKRLGGQVHILCVTLIKKQQQVINQVILLCSHTLVPELSSSLTEQTTVIIWPHCQPCPRNFLKFWSRMAGWAPLSERTFKQNSEHHAVIHMHGFKYVQQWFICTPSSTFSKTDAAKTVDRGLEHPYSGKICKYVRRCQTCLHKVHGGSAPRNQAGKLPV